MLLEATKAEVLRLAQTCTQQEIADRLGISRSAVHRCLSEAGVRTPSPRGRKRPKTDTAPCSVCGTEVILHSARLRNIKAGRTICCSKDCRTERARKWALSYEHYRSGKEANRWKHGFYSNPAREARITIAAIRRYIREGADK